MCFYSRRIKESDKIYTLDEKKLKHKGYTLCRCCSYLGQDYRKDKLKIEKFVKDNHMKVWFEKNEFHIETSIAAWKVVDPGNRDYFLLYHSNDEVYRWLKREQGKILHHYHFQGDVRKDSILEYMEYIKKHDEWRTGQLNEYKTLPRTSKRQKKEYQTAKNKSKGKQVRNVLNLLEKIQAEREYYSSLL